MWRWLQDFTNEFEEGERMSVLDGIKRGFGGGVRVAKAACDKHNRSMAEWVSDGFRRREEIRIAIIGAK